MTAAADAHPDPPGEGAQWVHAAGGSSVRGVIQGDRPVGNIISTGDHARFFVGAYERLGESYVQPWSVFHRVGLHRFSGRGWLRDEVQAFLREQPCGYFVLEAAAGLGKTAFMAHLVQCWGCAHHFAETTPGPDGVAPALKSLTAQLLLEWKLPPAAADEVLPGAATRPDYLQTLVFEAARARDASRPGTPIVIVVDGLDEAGTPAEQNVLGLPRVLPDGVYFVVSQRPVEVVLQVEAPRRVFRLEAEQEPNLNDMRGFLTHAAHHEPVRSALADAGNTAADFVATLLDRSGGVWVYLHYVVEEIVRGERLPLNLGSLPRGVWQYYAQHWQRWRDRRGSAWEADLRVLATLTAARDDLPASLLATLAGIPDDASLRKLLERWLPFLTVAEAGERRFRLYHASLREFLDGRAETLELTAAERALTRELADATRAAHGRISDLFLSTWGGLDAGLPALGAPDAWSVADRYGVKHLAAHLVGAERAPDLHRLLAAECTPTSTPGGPPLRAGAEAAGSGWFNRLLARRRTPDAAVTPRNAWYAVHEQGGDVAGYMADLERAWQLADEAGLAAAGGMSGHAAPSVGEAAVLGLRYALVRASINTVAENVPPGLLPLLVQEGMWHPLQALTYARHVPDARQRAEALTGLIPCLPPDHRDPTARDALTAIEAIRHPWERPPAVRQLIPYLPPDRLRHLLANVGGFAFHQPGTFLLWIARHAPASLLEEVVNDPDGVNWVEYVDLVGVLSDFLPETGRLHAVLEASIFRDEARPRIGDVLVARHLPEPRRSEVLPRIVGALSWQGYWAPEPELVPLLLPHMSDAAVRGAVAILLNEKQLKEEQLAAIAALSPRLAHGEKLAVADSVFGWMDGLEGYAREGAARNLVPHLAAMGIADDVLTRAAVSHDRSRRSVIIEALAAHLSERGVRSAFSLLGDDRLRYTTRDARSALFIRLAELGHPDECLRDAPKEIQTAAWLSAIANFLDPPRRRPVVDAALCAAGTLGSDGVRSGFEVATWVEAARLRAAPGDPREVPYHLGTAGADVIAPVLAALPEAGRAAWLKELSARRDISDALRARALAHLLPWARGWKRGMMVRRILRLARRFDKDVHARILLEAAVNLDGAEQVRMTRKLLALAEGVPTQHLAAPWGSESLPGAAAVLDQVVVAQFRAARRYHYRGKIQVLTALAPRMANLGHMDEVASTAAELDSDARNLLLASVAPHLTAAEREQIFQTCTAHLYSDARLAAAVSLLGWQPEATRASALPGLLGFARESMGYHEGAAERATAILNLVPHVPAVEREQLLDDAMRTAEVSALDDWRAAPGVLEQVAIHVAGCDPATRQSLWQKALRRLARRSRGDLVEALGGMVPLLAAIGGLDAVLSARETMTQVLRSWK